MKGRPEGMVSAGRDAAQASSDGRLLAIDVWCVPPPYSSSTMISTLRKSIG